MAAEEVDDGDPPIDQAEVERLVESLGAEQFSTRESATRRLLQLGARVIPSLRVAAGSSDREIRFRSRRIMTLIEREQTERIVHTFLEGDTLRDGQQLPGWKEFATLAGDTQRTRHQFVEIYKQEQGLLVHLSATQQVAASAVSNRIVQLSESRRSRLFEKAPIHSLMAVLLLVSREDVHLDETDTHRLFSLLSDELDGDLLRAGANRETVQQLLRPWLKRADSQDPYVVLSLGMKYGIADVIPFAERTLSQPSSNTTLSRRFAIQTIAKFGDQSHLSLLETCFADKTRVSTRTAADQVRITEVRDIALAAAVHVSGQDLHEFGFENFVGHADFVFVDSSLGFASDEQREAAFAAWQLLSSRHP